MTVEASIEIWEKHLGFITLDMDLPNFQYVLDHLESTLVEEYEVEDPNFEISEIDKKITFSLENMTTVREALDDLITECELSISWDWKSQNSGEKTQ